MACPNCDHTMQGIGKLVGSYALICWCPRCGTIGQKPPTRDEIEAGMPHIVERTRELLSLLAEAPKGGKSPNLKILRDKAWTIGVAESVGFNQDMKPVVGMKMPPCEVCDKPATNFIVDMERSVDWRTSVYKTKPHGKPHAFCDDHKRDSEVFDATIGPYFSQFIEDEN